MLALLWTLLAIAAGTLAAYLVEPPDEESPQGLGVRLAQGVALGFVALGLVGYGVTAWAGWGGAGQGLITLTLLGALIYLWQQTPTLRGLRKDLKRLRGSGKAYFWLIPAVPILALLFHRAIYIEGGGLFTAYDNNLGDLTFHLGIIFGFACGDNFPPVHPEFAHSRLTYPFLADFLVALGGRQGLDLLWVMLVENLVLSLALITLMYRFGRKLTGKASVGYLTPVLIWLSGGLGGFLALKEWWQSGRNLFEFLLHLPHDYTLMDGYRWGNAVTVMFVPQRALLLGLPLALMAWTLWWQAYRQDEPERRPLEAAGILIGLLPLAHAHTYVTSMLLATLLALLRPRRVWVWFFVPALVLAGPQMWWATRGAATKAGSFFGVALGWDHGQTPVWWFWLSNAGLFLPLWLAGLGLAWRDDRRLGRFQLPFAFLFLLANLFRLSPWLWDNVKILFVWLLASAPLVALALVRIPRPLAVLCLGLLTFSGGLDVWRILTGCSPHLEFDPASQIFAMQVRQATPPEAVILADPAYNSPIELTGRHLLMGYIGHLWSQGLDYGARADAVRQIYGGSALALPLLREYKVNYVVVGPQERQEHDNFLVNEAFFQQFPLVVQAGEYRLYKIP